MNTKNTTVSPNGILQFTATEEKEHLHSSGILVGMESGISNTAFSYIELIRDRVTNALIDFKHGGTYYFKKELDAFFPVVYIV